MRSLFALALLAIPAKAHAFCGFYVAKADAALFNHASQVALVREGQHTVLTMSNDYQGDLTEFAVVVPVPSVITREQVHIGDPKLLARLDSWSGPRLVEYYDHNPCAPERMHEMRARSSAMSAAPAADRSAAALGVTIEAEYTVGEYDIVILSAKQSSGLYTWLTSEGYHVPAKAADALAPYIKQDMKFFVAKVNLKEQAKTGVQNLRPIQIAYDSEKFMLPIRLGMANADGSQDLMIYTITKSGRVESTNYRTVKMPTDEKVPLFVKSDFKTVYKAIFEHSYQKEDRRAVFTEYAWASGWCDPCADQPLTPEELRGLGVFWLDADDGAAPGRPVAPRMLRPPFRGGGNQPFITRLHVRYDREHFPEDLVFQTTGDTANYQARYVLNHPYEGELSCDAAAAYKKSVDDRHELEATTLSALTGWSRDEVVQKMGAQAPVAVPPAADAGAEPWYKRLWK